MAADDLLGRGAKGSLVGDLGDRQDRAAIDPSHHHERAEQSLEEPRQRLVARLGLGNRHRQLLRHLDGDRTIEKRHAELCSHGVTHLAAERPVGGGDRDKCQSCLAIRRGADAPASSLA